MQMGVPRANKVATLCLVKALSNITEQHRTLTKKLSNAKTFMHRPTGISELAEWWQIAENTPEKTGLGLQAGQQFNCDMMGATGFQVASSPNIKTALSIFINWLNESGVLQVVHQEKSNHWIIDLNFNYDQLPFKRSLAEYICSSIHCLIVQHTVESFHPVLLMFAKGDSVSGELYEQFFQCQVEVNTPHYKMLYDKKLLSAPLISADPNIHQILCDYMKKPDAKQKGSLTCRVRQVIEKQLETSAPTIESVAAEMTMSSRNLQRELTRRNRCYKHLLADIQKQKSAYLLRYTSLSISEVAFKLGYERTTSFYRVFNKWFQTTPKDYRQQIGWQR